jgi:mRNA deadenylase 3'-5' endonuclease subunit Ccr4
LRYNYPSTFTRVNTINFKDKEEINQISSPIASSNTAVSVSVANTQLKIATFNLFNYLEPPNAYYEFERIYSAEQWQKKQRWLTEYLREYQPDIIGFQEVFSPESLKKLVTSQGYDYF